MMFFFGDPNDSADLLIEQSKRSKGPNAPEIPLEEMEEKDLRIAFTYLYIAVTQADRDAVAEDVLSALLSKYDHAFVLLARKSEQFRTAVEQNEHRWVLGYTKENISKYKRLAREAASAS